MRSAKKKLHIYVLMGGPSAEHDVSLQTGRMIIKNLDRKKFTITPILITKTGKWVVGGRGRAPVLKDTARGHSLRASGNHVAFIAMHGTYGEDGTLQGLLELAGIPYTGSGVLASALAMDKVRSAQVLTHYGIHTPPHIAFTKDEWRKSPAALKRKIASLGWPLVIKPRNLGSSVGITIVGKPSELEAAVRRAAAHSPQLMAQQYIRGREITCAVIDKGIPGTETALLPTEIVPKSSVFFDYRAKYTPGASEEITPPRLPKSLITHIQRTALTCHRALGCSGMSRTDMILENPKPQSQKPKLYVLEVNTIPGMTETSLLPQAAKACGISFPKLLEHIILAALNRSRYNRL